MPFLTPQPLVVVSLSASQPRLILAKRLASSASQPPPGSLASRGPVPGSRARTSFSLSSSSRGQARGQRVASPAPRSGGGGDASGLCLRRELGEEVSLNCGFGCGFRGGGVGLTRDGKAQSWVPSLPGTRRNFELFEHPSFNCNGSLCSGLVSHPNSDCGEFVSGHRWVQMKGRVITIRGGLGNPCVVLAFECGERLQGCGFRFRSAPFTHSSPVREKYLTFGCIWSCLFPGNGNLTT